MSEPLSSIDLYAQSMVSFSVLYMYITQGTLDKNNNNYLLEIILAILKDISLLISSSCLNYFDFDNKLNSLETIFFFFLIQLMQYYNRNIKINLIILYFNSFFVNNTCTIKIPFCLIGYFISKGCKLLVNEL